MKKIGLKESVIKKLEGKDDIYYCVEGRQKSAPAEYFNYVKDIISKELGIPKKVMENITTRDETFRSDCVSIRIDDRIARHYDTDFEKLIKDNKNKIINLFENNAEVVLYSYDEDYEYPIIHVKYDYIKSKLDTNSKSKLKEKPIISFWITSVGDGYHDYYAYGAKISDGDFKFPGSLGSIQKRLGERYFTMYYSKGISKILNTYTAFKNFFERQTGNSLNKSEQELIEEGYDEGYYIVEGR